MRLGFDESGSFDFSSRGLEAAAVVGAICPDSLVPSLARQFDALRSAWQLEELHAARMTPDQLVEICALIGASETIWFAAYTDNRLFPLSQQLDWRQRQQARAEVAIARSTTLSDDPTREQTVATMRGRLEHSTRVSTAEYLEFIVLFPTVVGRSIQAAITRYQSLAYANDFAAFRFEFDGKLRGKMSAGEKTMATALRYILVGDERFALDLPLWPDDHPCFVNHAISGPRSIAAHEVLRDLRFPDSADSELVQMADVIAHVVRRAASNPADTVAQRCWKLLRRRAFVHDGRPLHVFSDRQGPKVKESDYAHLSRPSS
jgi:hypothetical protein